MRWLLGARTRKPIRPRGLDYSCDLCPCLCRSARACHSSPPVWGKARQGRPHFARRVAVCAVCRVVPGLVSRVVLRLCSPSGPVRVCAALTAADRRVRGAGGSGFCGAISLCVLVHRTPCERLTAGARTDTHPLIRSSIVSRMRVTANAKRERDPPAHRSRGTEVPVACASPLSQAPCRV